MYKTEMLSNIYQADAVASWVILFCCILGVAGPMLMGAIKPFNFLWPFWSPDLKSDYFTIETKLNEMTQDIPMCRGERMQHVCHMYAVQIFIV